MTLRVTQIQEATLDFMKRYNSEHGFFPTITEITEAMGWKSRNTAYLHVKALEKKGIVQRKHKRSRSIVLADNGISLPDINDSEYWYEGVFKPQLYQRDVVDAIKSAGMKVKEFA